MARITMTSGFTLIPEGTYVFRITDVAYDEEFGKLVVSMVTANGMTHKERFSLKDQNDQPNESAYNAFSYFAKTALDNFDLEDIDHTDLIGCYIRAEVIHKTQPNRKDPKKNITFANLGDKSPAHGFDNAPAAETATAAPATKKSGGIDLNALLGS